MTEESDTDSAETVIRHPGPISPVIDVSSQYAIPTVDTERRTFGVHSQSSHYTSSNMESVVKDGSDDEQTSLSQYTLSTQNPPGRNGDEDQTLFTISTLDGQTVITEGQATFSSYDHQVAGHEGRGEEIGAEQFQSINQIDGQEDPSNYVAERLTSEGEPSQYAISNSDEESTGRGTSGVSLSQYTLQSMDEQKLDIPGQTILSQHTLPNISDQCLGTEGQTTLSQYTLPSMDYEKLETPGQTVLSQYTLPSVGRPSDVEVEEQTAPSQYTLESMDDHKDGQTTLSQYTLSIDGVERDRSMLYGSPLQPLEQNTSGQVCICKNPNSFCQ